MKNLFRLLGVVLISGCIGFAPMESSFAADNPEMVINELIENYRTLSSYSDKGEVHIEVEKEGIIRTIGSKTFSTTYSQTNLSMTWVDVNPGLPLTRSQLYSTNDGYSVELLNSDIRFYDEAAVALSSVEGVSGGIAFLAPRFLMKEIQCKPLLGALSAELFVKQINGSKYYVVELVRENNVVDEMWISSNSLLLRKHIREATTPIGVIVTTIEYEEVLINGSN